MKIIEKISLSVTFKTHIVKHIYIDIDMSERLKIKSKKKVQ